LVRPSHGNNITRKDTEAALTTTAGRERTADVRELSAVLQCDLQNTFPPDKRMDGDYQNAVPPADYRSAVPPDKHMNDSDECMYGDHREPEPRREAETLRHALESICMFVPLFWHAPHKKREMLFCETTVFTHI